MKKAFRLFISSTFSDFKEEREFLQSSIFPRLTQYCEVSGYQFEPIDLRWGVQAEAQLDQKTLEVCLNQVKACKQFPHPNFLIMVGSRYGWVPLPYAIERQEFLRIRRYLRKHDPSKVELLKQWYRLDKNHLYLKDSGASAAYVLVSRAAEFESSDVWIAVESRLRDMLQGAAKELGLAGKERDKYFLSATEHEVIEGIIDYRGQDSPDDTDSDGVDSQYVFSFLRGRDESRFDDEVLAFRRSLRTVIPPANIFESNEVAGYCEAFGESLFGFLKHCVDQHIATVSNIPALDQELAEQGAYFTQKVANFFGRQDTLVQVDEYLAGGGNLPDQPLVLFGPSGIGKSALLAKVVERTRSRGGRVVFRFIGATLDSSSSRSLLTSLCQECAATEDPQLAFEDRGEPFNEFSLRVARFLDDLKSPVILVVDALDQLVNGDELLWLPEHLRPGLRIVLSVLSDPNYREDSRYYTLLAHRSVNLLQIPGLPDIGQLLDELLVSRRRALQPGQRNYVLKQYAKTCSPLYLRVVMEEVVNWKSYDGHKFIGNNQREAIAALIHNLSAYYHHDPKFVHRVFGYILASDEGITESELISVFSSNVPLLQRLVPETFHVNATRKLPLGIWARLHFQLQNFLVTKFSDGYGLLNFFHREFRDATRVVVPFQVIHEELIQQLEKIVSGIQASHFGVTRWGKLLAQTFVLYSIQNDDRLEQAFANFIANLKNDAWVSEYIRFVEYRGDYYNQHNQMARALIYTRHFCAVVDILYRMKGAAWMPQRVRSLSGLAGTYFNLNRLNDAADLEAKAIDVLGSVRSSDSSLLKLLVQTLLNHSATLEKLSSPADSLRCKEKAFQALQDYVRDPEFDDLQLKCLIELSYHHAEHLGDSAKALKLSSQALELARRLKNENESKYIKYYVAILVNTSIWIGDVDTAISYEQQALDIVEGLMKQNRALWVIHYATCLNNLAFSYEEKGLLAEAEAIFTDVLEDVRCRYQVDKDRWTRAYAKSLTNIAQFYLNRQQVELATANFADALEVITIKYRADPKDWTDQYLKKTMNITSAYRAAGNYQKCAQLETTALGLVERLHESEPGKWHEAYGFILNRAIETCRQANQGRRLRVLQKKLEALTNGCEDWNVFYRKNPIVISTVFHNR